MSVPVDFDDFEGKCSARCRNEDLQICKLFCYRPRTEYDGKVMFSVCLFTGPPRSRSRGPPRSRSGSRSRGAPGQGPGGTPLELGGHPQGYPPELGGTPGGTPKIGQKCWTKIWTKNLETFGGGGGGVAGGTPLAVTQEDCLVSLLR